MNIKLHFLHKIRGGGVASNLVCTFNWSNMVARFGCIRSCFFWFIADNIPTYIIFSNRHEIRRLEVNKHSYVSLVSGLRNTIALDFYYNKTTPNGDGSLVFWTDVVDDKIYRGILISNCKFCF